jgi:hypothetical protein
VAGHRSGSGCGRRPGRCRRRTQSAGADRRLQQLLRRTRSSACPIVAQQHKSRR